MPTISVIVPVYKVEKYIHRCVDSILGQTFRDFELILVDDGSPDNCPAICDEYAAKDSRIHVIHQANGGLSAARNAGIDWMFVNSDSRYIAFVDSDDYIYPQMLEKLHGCAVEHSADVSICRMISFTEEVPELESIVPEVKIYSNIEVCSMLCDYNQAGGIVAACGKLLKRKLFNCYRFPIGKIHEDQFLSHRILYAADKIAIVEEKLYGYFYNTDGISKGGFSLKRYDNVWALSEAVQFYLDHNESELAAKADEMMRLFVAIYSIYARKNKMYHRIPKAYRMSIVKAGRTIRRMFGYDKYEWELAQEFPRIAKIQAKVRRLACLAVKLKE